MNKSKLMKIFLTILLGIMLVLTSTNVFADDEEDLGNDLDLTPTNNILQNTNVPSNTANNNSNNNSSNNNAVLNNSTVTSSSYNTTNLPKTGIADSLPVVVLIVVFGISSVYAYKKISDYKNI